MPKRVSKPQRVSGAVRGGIRGSGAGIGGGAHATFHETHQAIRHLGNATLLAGVTPVIGGVGAYKGVKKGWQTPNSKSVKLRPKVSVHYERPFAG